MLRIAEAGLSLVLLLSTSWRLAPPGIRSPANWACSHPARRPGRHLPADRRTHQGPARPARQALGRAPEEDHGATQALPDQQRYQRQATRPAFAQIKLPIQARPGLIAAEPGSWAFARLWGANSDRYGAPGHVQLVSVQLNRLSGHTQRLLATVKVCLLSSGSRVRILPGAQAKDILRY